MNSIDDSGPTGNAIRLGTIAEVDLAAARCTVICGDIETDWIPWLCGRAGETRVWSPPSIGEQVLLISPEADTESAIAIPGLFSDAMPAPAGTLAERIQFGDGAVISYDPESHVLSAILPAGGAAEIEAPGGITLTGDVTIIGKVDVTEDVVAGGISLKSHKHGNVQAGGAKTSAPE